MVLHPLISSNHGSRVEGADQIWFAAIRPGIRPLGEIRQPEQLYQVQPVQTIAKLLGLKFIAEHPVEEAIKGI